MSPVDQIDGKIDAEGKLYFSDQFYKRLEETFSESPIFDELERILQEPEPLDWYSIRDFDLSTARNNERIADFNGEGDIVLVISYTGKAEVKFDSPNADSFDLETYKEIKHSYTELYLTNEAQSGATIKILFGRGDWGFTKRILEIDLHGTVPGGKLNLLTHLLTEGTWTDNSPAAGSVAWSGVKVIYRGITYTIADGNTNQAYIWWDFSLSTITFQTSNVKPALTDDDFIVAYNDGGTHILIWNATLIDGRVIRTGTLIADDIIVSGATTLADWRHPSDLTLINGGQIFTHSIEANKLSILTHILSGAGWADNDPAAGSISWAGAEVTYNGNTYNIADGNTALAYIWWDFSLSTTTFQTSNVKPALTDDDFIVCYNDSGTHELIWNATLIEGRTLRTGTITADEINVIGLDASGRIVVGDATDADEVTGGINTHATTLILPGKIVISGGTNLEDWRAAGDLTMIDGGDIFANSVTATQINVVGLDATGRIVVGDVTDADEVTAGINVFATTLILPGKIIISGGTNLEDWRHATDLTMIDGGNIYAHSIVATQVLVSGATDLADWRAGGDLTKIDGGDIFANSITAVQAQFDDLINVSGKMTLAAGRVIIDKDAFGANLEGIRIHDGVRNTVEIGELTAGNYGITVRDAAGERHMFAGDPRSTTRVSVNLSSQQSNIPNATMTKVLLNAEWFDPGNNFASNRFTAPKDGYYFIVGQLAWINLPADEAANLRMMQNGSAGTRLASAIGVFNSSPNLFATAMSSTLVWLDQGDYVELFGIHWVGDNTPDIYGWGGRGETFMTVHYVWGGV